MDFGFELNVQTSTVFDFEVYQEMYPAYSTASEPPLSDQYQHLTKDRSIHVKTNSTAAQHYTH